MERREFLSCSPLSVLVRIFFFLLFSSAEEQTHRDIPMGQFIINYNASLPASHRFIIHILDNTHMFVQPNVADMIRNAMSEFRDQNSYEKPT
ncbi:RNA polymerase II transcription factor B subunit 5 isoform X2 [Cucurbita maxima]|uniref:General transcription and DNA repair factor IIH subunit TFB5 n=1 Tax=Cucurbita maxima TaxID=3661 RepID=A0A6J1KTL4_CUCMA|nr:RNA polymerase II transcription factor B subunit 5 isoform X2 [Cucurbita maxima]